MRFWRRSSHDDQAIIGPSDQEERLVYKDATFADLDDRDSGHIVQNIDFDGCVFQNCTLSAGGNPARRTVVRRVNVRNTRCPGRHASIGATVFDDVTIENLQCGEILLIWGAAFRHVILSGQVPSINFNGPFELTPAQDSVALRDANQEFYRSVDWALDISRARFSSVTFRSIPGQLIRRDPETQVLLSKARLREAIWEKLPLPPQIRIAVEFVAEGNNDFQVVAAGRRSKSFKEDMKGIETLRRAALTIE